MSQTRGLQVLHRPNFCGTTSQTELVDARQSLLARVTYDSDTDQFRCSCFVDLPAHFIQGFIDHSRHLLLPTNEPFRVRHHFALLDERFNPSPIANRDLESVVRITDDLFSVMYSTLQWIPVWAMSQEPERVPINPYCVHMIRHDGAPLLLRLLEHWVGIFSTGPEQLIFHDSSVLPWSDDGSEDGTWYLEDKRPASHVLDREECIDMLRQLIRLCHTLLEHDEHHYIYHGGI